MQTTWITDSLGISTEMQQKLLVTALVLALLALARHYFNSTVNKHIQDAKAQYRWRKTAAYISYSIAFFTVARVWFNGFQSVSTYLGLLSAGLAIALQDPLVNLAGWLFILWRKPFVVGDRIQIGDYRGDVIDQRLFNFSLMEIGNWVKADQSTGRVIHVPNGKVFREVMANYSSGFKYIWDEKPVLLTFESDWRKAKTILTTIAQSSGEKLTADAEATLKKASGKYMIFYNKLTPKVYTTVQDSGVLLTARFLCEPRKRRARDEEFWEAVLDEFAKHPDIDFAYPTQRLFDNRTEGKPGIVKTPLGFSQDQNDFQ